MFVAGQIFVRRAFRSCGGLRVTAAEELAGLVSRTLFARVFPLIAGPPAALGSVIPSTKIWVEFVLKEPAITCHVMIVRG